MLPGARAHHGATLRLWFGLAHTSAIDTLRCTTYIEPTHTKKIPSPGAVKDIVRLFGAIGDFERGLHLEGVAERAEDRPDQVFL
jgi:hypothetical protein